MCVFKDPVVVYEQQSLISCEITVCMEMFPTHRYFQKQIGMMKQSPGSSLRIDGPVYGESGARLN